MKLVAIIPARGGSKGIPRKNVRMMLGRPLISYSIENALKSPLISDVVVSTDDSEISRISEQYGATVVKRPAELATDVVTLDPVINHALEVMELNAGEKYDAVITLQPTSPLLKTDTLELAINDFVNGDYDTIISGVNKPHLAWTETGGEYVPVYEKRVNRQYLPKNFLETGAFVISKRECVSDKGRIGNKISIFEMPERESVDIDSDHDWWIAEKELSRKSILIRTEGYSEIGMGHIYRCLLLAYNLIDHDVKFIISQKSDLGIEKIANSFFPMIVMNDNQRIDEIIKSEKCDIFVNDMLDTDEDYIRSIKKTGVRVVNFEDLGGGSKIADAVINDLYEPKLEGANYYWGSEYYCIRDEFLIATPKPFSVKVTEVLVLFGGTDPSNLTEKVLKAILDLPIATGIKFRFILGMGYSKADALYDMIKDSDVDVDIVHNVSVISEYMASADIAVSSQGRTMLELASMAVPTILMAQNNRELHHEFGYLKNGFINLGIGSEINEGTIRETLTWLINSTQIRMQMKEQMLSVDLKSGMKRVKNIILDKN